MNSENGEKINKSKNKKGNTEPPKVDLYQREAKAI